MRIKMRIGEGEYYHSSMMSAEQCTGIQLRIPNEARRLQANYLRTEIIREKGFKKLYTVMSQSVNLTREYLGQGRSVESIGQKLVLYIIHRTIFH
jgi:hypothetical protein